MFLTRAQRAVQGVIAAFYVWGIIWATAAMGLGLILAGTNPGAGVALFIAAVGASIMRLASPPPSFARSRGGR